MFTAGGTGGGPGAPSYNLALAQFQQMVADAERDCRKCNGNSCKARQYCKRLVCCKFCTCARGKNELGGGDSFSRSCCSRAKKSLSSCSSNRSCDRCCGQCRYRSKSSRSNRHSSSSQTASVQPAPAVAAKKVE
jgi:hypothetical protein